MYYVKEKVTKCRRGKDGLIHCKVIETGRMIPVPYTPSRKVSAVEDAYYGGGYGTSNISLETFAKTYYKK